MPVWLAMVTSGGGAMLVWWPGGARTLKSPWCESRRISNSHVGNYSIQVGKSRRWITLCLWESQWIEKSRRLVPVGIFRLLIQLHGYFWLVNLLACVNCYDQWVAVSTIVGPVNSPLPLAMPMWPVGVTPSQFSWHWSATHSEMDGSRSWLTLNLSFFYISVVHMDKIH